MKSLRNSVQLIGRLGKDPEMIELKSGKKVARFSLATNESYRNQNGEKVEETQWHNRIKIFRSLVEKLTFVGSFEELKFQKIVDFI